MLLNVERLYPCKESSNQVMCFLMNIKFNQNWCLQSKTEINGELPPNDLDVDEMTDFLLHFKYINTIVSAGTFFSSVLFYAPASHVFHAVFSFSLKNEWQKNLSNANGTAGGTFVYHTEVHVQL